MFLRKWACNRFPSFYKPKLVFWVKSSRFCTSTSQFHTRRESRRFSWGNLKVYSFSFKILIERMEINCSTPFNPVDEIEEDPEPVYFPLIYRIVGTVLQVPILICGLLGNSLVVFVLAKSRSLWSPTNCYLVSLAIADCIVLMVTVQEIVSYYLLENEWIWGDVGCSLSAFWQNLGITASSLSLVAVTVQRWV